MNEPILMNFRTETDDSLKTVMTLSDCDGDFERGEEEIKGSESKLGLV